MRKRWLAALVIAIAASGLGEAQQKPGAHVTVVLKTVAPDLEARLARFKPVRMPYNTSALSPRERQMVDQLVIALRQF